MILSRSSCVRDVKALNKQFQPAFHFSSNFVRETISFSNSASLSRHSFSPSVVIKSVHRDSILPHRCLTIVAMLLQSSLYCQKSFSSGTWEKVFSPSIL